MSPLLQRALVLYVPIFTVAALVLWRKPDRRWAGGLLLGFGWSVVTIVALSAVAHAAGWWKLSAPDHLWLGVPVDLLIGWALFWGPLPALLFPNRPFAAVAGVCWLDLWIMPASGGVLELGLHWVIGELLGVGFCLLPALLITAWTRDDRRLPARVGAQVAIFGGLNLMVVLAVLRAHDPGWAADLAGSGALELGVLAQALAATAVIAAAAVSEFRRVGKGTPFPYDPPARLVVSGPYAYIANPMQLAMTAGFLILAAFTGAFQLALAGVVAAAIAAGIARWHEGEQLRLRFGDEWERHCRVVRRWIPHLRPVWAREAA
jgi:protein-S-isoprenylcysteine O-methyltransferase Ste14